MSAPEQWSPFTDGTLADLQTLASRRNVSIAGLELARARGVLKFACHNGWCRSWIVTDASGQASQARRMDGQLWKQLGGKKSWTLRGSNGRWPVGIASAEPFPCIAIVEGGPDLLAAFHFIAREGRQNDCTAVAMMGGGRIDSQSLPLFTGKRVRIFADADAPGAVAAQRWQSQLCEWAAHVDCFNLAGLLRADGLPVKDLNDLCYMDPGALSADPDLAAIVPEPLEVACE